MVRLNRSFDGGDVAGISGCLLSVTLSPPTLAFMPGQVFGGIIETSHSVESRQRDRSCLSCGIRRGKCSVYRPICE